MSKYIDADKLLDIIIKMRKECATQEVTEGHKGLRAVLGGQCLVLTEIIDIIDSLQQGQPELPGIEEPGIPGKDFIPVEWVDACEMYGKWKIVKQEQPEVDLEKEIRNYNVPLNGWERLTYNTLKEIARHFYELGLNAK